MDLRFQFGCPTAGVHPGSGSITIALPNPVIAGDPSEAWATGLTPAGTCGALQLWNGNGELWGVGTAEVGAGFEPASRALYADLFRAAGGRSLYRIWNFVPGINEEQNALENYRAFCIGRARAFEDVFPADTERRMPAASAVGSSGGRLCVAFVAGQGDVRYVENPLQVPAYRYPERYGPRPPSFARGSVVDEAARRRLFISGTASIRGSESQHHGDVRAQLALALENADTVAAAAGWQGLDPAGGAARRFRLYLRDPEHWPAVEALLRQRLRPDDRLTAVQADICRRELLVELEVYLAKGPSCHRPAQDHA